MLHPVNISYVMGIPFSSNFYTTQVQIIHTLLKKTILNFFILAKWSTIVFSIILALQNK